MPTASQARPRSSRIPTWPQPRPWSTQYHDDYNKRRHKSRICYRPRGHTPCPQSRQDFIATDNPTQSVRSHSHQEALTATKTYRHEDEEIGIEMNVPVDPDFVITGTQIPLTHRGEQGERSVGAILRDLGIDSDTDENMEYTGTAEMTQLKMPPSVFSINPSCPCRNDSIKNAAVSVQYYPSPPACPYRNDSIKNAAVSVQYYPSPPPQLALTEMTQLKMPPSVFSITLASPPPALTEMTQLNMPPSVFSITPAPQPALTEMTQKCRRQCLVLPQPPSLPLQK
ncbi:hypothetical protein CHS0354_012002 [Potamilus streckersoni]|uniref:Uncharacterized protein n=1 Tax=Potamilus streckersoni TaxID=2493646 RepID=A0AAE0SCH0_9BIVA|nr:hypothetical protein CHS0354_012002 [Potamilus streckersoni]